MSFPRTALSSFAVALTVSITVSRIEASPDSSASSTSAPEERPASEPSAPGPSEDPSSLPETITFANSIAAIVFENCTECHRPGEAAPFALTSYDDVRKRGRLIAKVTKDRYMPPWHPVEGYGEFEGVRRLSDREIALIGKWLETGMVEGDPKDTPAPPSFDSEWRIGAPDLVVTMDEPFEIPADGPDIYRNFALPLQLGEEHYVTQIEIRPSARSVVHHALYFVDTTGEARERDARDRTPGFPGMGFRNMRPLGGWAVGAAPMTFPQEVARPLPRGSDLVVQIHFHPSGKRESEKTSIGLRFAKGPPSRTLVSIQLPPVFGFFSGIDIPADDASYKVKDSFELPVDVELLSAGGHAHYIARSMRSTAVLPSGEEKPLFFIDDWDFNWQGRYTYAKPVRLPKGTVIRSELTYDNSAANPRNPFDPPRRIRWGLESTDEMAAITFMAVPVDEDDAALLRTSYRRHLGQAARRGARSFLGRALSPPGGDDGGDADGPGGDGNETRDSEGKAER